MKHVFILWRGNGRCFSIWNLWKLDLVPWCRCWWEQITPTSKSTIVSFDCIILHIDYKRKTLESTLSMINFWLKITNLKKINFFYNQARKILIFPQNMWAHKTIKRIFILYYSFKFLKSKKNWFRKSSSFEIFLQKWSLN